MGLQPRKEACKFTTGLLRYVNPGQCLLIGGVPSCLGLVKSWMRDGGGRSEVGDGWARGSLLPLYGTRLSADCVAVKFLLNMKKQGYEWHVHNLAPFIADLHLFCMLQL